MAARSDGRDPQIHCLNTTYVEELLREYLQDPQHVLPAWRDYFQQMAGPSRPRSIALLPPREHQARGKQAASRQQGNGAPRRPTRNGTHLQDRVDQLIHAYRVRGHLAAKLDPLGLAKAEPPELDPATYGIRACDLKREISTMTAGGPASQSVRQLIHRLRSTYCRYIGAQFMHIDDPEIRGWLQQRMEQTQNHLRLSRAQQVRILKRLTDAVILSNSCARSTWGPKPFRWKGPKVSSPFLIWPSRRRPRRE